MTTTPDHHEPLDAQERDLAARLGRLGPFEGPSPALDAKILAAAHAAAVARTPGRRRGGLAWLSIPPALITGTGVAAAAVLALGLVWQMLPQQKGLVARSEAAGDEEIILIAPPADTAAAPAANPPPFPVPPAPAAPAPRAQSAAQPERAAAPAVPAEMPAAAAPAAAAVAEEANELAAEAAAEDAKREADATAGAAMSREVAAAEAEAKAARSDHATYTTAARAAAERRARRNAPQAAAPVAEASDEATLDRVEVSGTRIKAAEATTDWSQVTVRDDARLSSQEWLERIRERRDQGDLDNARASLRLFQREYPRIRLPDDLRALLADAKR